eukprot:CAMPEP_0198214236 /NCGR_PEP_ID=MMETSP1445-20131203/39415_1 /TAXON_ID=36898 /ORGANISM="Pyramimonas sp., Strain CCMP2087" /LENGTH=134 /DNA_ID=CAMNT_0043889325 /DNA_START=172 /DNA_END=572 /DNA_ORIENTATION=-
MTQEGGAQHVSSSQRRCFDWSWGRTSSGCSTSNRPPRRSLSVGPFRGVLKWFTVALLLLPELCVCAALSRGAQGSPEAVAYSGHPQRRLQQAVAVAPTGAPTGAPTTGAPTISPTASSNTTSPTALVNASSPTA